MTKHKYGIPVLTHLKADFISEFYKLLFLASSYDVGNVDYVIKNIFENQIDEDGLATVVENLKSVLHEDYEDKNHTLNKENYLKEKLTSWVRQFPNITEEEIAEYLKFHDIRTFTMEEILAFRVSLSIKSPAEIKAILDHVIIGQERAKKVMCFTFYLHLIRTGIIKPYIHGLKQVDIPLGAIPLPKPNILLIGPTGSGKTLTIKTLCNLFGVPFIKVDCSSLTSSGYIGNNLNDYLKILLNRYGPKKTAQAVMYFDEFDKLSEMLYGGGQRGSVGGIELQQEFLSFLEDSDRIITRSPREEGEAQEKVDISNIMFVFSGSFNGIEHLIEKRVAERSGSIGFKKSQDFLHEKNTNILQSVRYDDVIKFGIIPELAGRLGFIAILDKLSKDEIIAIMKQSRGNVIEQYRNYFTHHFDKLVVEEDVYDLIAGEVLKRNIGARALNTVVIELLQELLYEAPNQFEEEFKIDAEFFRRKFG